MCKWRLFNTFWTFWCQDTQSIWFTLPHTKYCQHTLVVKIVAKISSYWLVDRFGIMKSDQKCDRAGVIYRTSCTECQKDVMVEDTYNYVRCKRTTVHARMVSHLKIQRQNNSLGPVYRHGLDVHEGRKQEYCLHLKVSKTAPDKSLWISCDFYIERGEK